MAQLFKVTGSSVNVELNEYYILSSTTTELKLPKLWLRKKEVIRPPKNVIYVFTVLYKSAVSFLSEQIASLVE